MSILMVSNLLETMMILFFGISWPFSIYKSYKSRTAKGKSLTFQFFIWAGYIFGITRKILLQMNEPGQDWLFYLSWFFYILNFVEITFDMMLYRRNVKLDRLRDAKQ